MLASLGAWIIFTLPLGFIQPPAASCIERKNSTDYDLKTPEVQRIINKRSLPENADLFDPSFAQFIDQPAGGEMHVRVRRAARPYGTAGISPIGVSYANNYVEKIHKNWVSPMFSSIVYRTEVSRNLSV